MSESITDLSVDLSLLKAVKATKHVRAHSRVIWLLRVGSQIKKSFIDKVQDFGTLTMEQKTFPKSVSISPKNIGGQWKVLTKQLWSWPAFFIKQINFSFFFSSFGTVLTVNLKKSSFWSKSRTLQIAD